MSADRTIVFYGIRLDITSEDLDRLDEDNGDPRIIIAEKQKLDVYYANFGGMTERFLLFIGKNLGSFGIEDNQEHIFTAEDLNAIFTDTNYRLAMATLNGVPKLYIEWQQDI